MGVKIVKDTSLAQAIVCGERFNVHGVLTTAILSKAIPNLTVARIAKVPSPIDANTIVYGANKSEFNQTQQGRGEVNGGHYMSVVAAWRRFGDCICADTLDPKKVCRFIEQHLMQKIIDVGYIDTFAYGSTLQMTDIAQIICLFNPQWNADTTTLDQNGLNATDQAFIRAVEVMENVLENAIKYVDARDRAKAKVQTAILESSFGVMVLDQYVPWEEALYTEFSEKANAVKVVVYPEENNGYLWHTAFDRALAPKEWWGLNGPALQDVTGHRSALFVDESGCVGGVQDFAEALSIARCIANISDQVMVSENEAEDVDESLGEKLCANFNRTAYLKDNGIIHVVPEGNAFLSGDEVEIGTTLQEIVLSCGYKQFNTLQCHQLVFSFDGKSIEELKDELRQRVAKNEKLRELHRDERRRWEAERQETGGIMIKVIDVDSYPGGFTVWVGLNSSYMSQTARSVVKQTGCFVGRSRAAVSGGRCVLSPPDCFVA